MARTALAEVTDELVVTEDAISWRARLRERLPRVPVAQGLRLLVIWHLVGVASSVVALIAARSTSLPGAVGTSLTVFWIGALVANAVAAYGLTTRRTWARTVSVSVTYLVFIVAALATIHRFGVFASGDPNERLGLNAFADGFATGVLALPVVAIGLLWVGAARSIGRRRPGAERLTDGLRYAGWVVVAIGVIWFLLAVDVVGGITHALGRLGDPLTLGAFLLALSAFLAFRFVWSPRVAAELGATRRQQEALTGLLFLSPNLLGFLAFFAGPLLFSLVISFFDWDLFGNQREFTGLGNYIEIFSLQLKSTDVQNAGPEVLKSGYQVLMHIDWFGSNWVLGARDILFWTSLKNITIFLVLAVPLAVLPALGLSTLLNSKMRGMRFYRAVYFIPSVAGVIGVTLVWKQLYSATVGWINYLNTRFREVFDFLPFISAPDQPVQTAWLSNTGTAMWAIVVVFAWSTFGFNTVLYLAGHQGISNDLYEAAELDGANAWQRFRRITIPQLRNTTFYVLATTSILAMQLFDIVFVLTNPPGAPSNSTLTPVLHLYDEGFRKNAQGYASAVAWVLFTLIFGLTLVQFRRQQAQDA